MLELYIKIQLIIILIISIPVFVASITKDKYHTYTVVEYFLYYLLSFSFVPLAISTIIFIATSIF